MSRMRFGLLGASLAALSLAAFGAATIASAAEPTLPPGAQILYTAAGVPVAVLVPMSAYRAASPAMVQAAPVAPMDVAQLVARQEAAMNGMMAQMQALMGAPFPGMPGNGFGPGPGIVAAAAAGPVAMCSESVTVVPSPNGGAPHVTVRRQGNACGPADAVNAGPTDTQVRMQAPQVQPAPLLQPTPTEPNGVRTIRVRYTHPVQDPARLHG